MSPPKPDETTAQKNLPRTCGDEPEDMDGYTDDYASAPHLRG